MYLFSLSHFYHCFRVLNKGGRNEDIGKKDGGTSTKSARPVKGVTLLGLNIMYPIVGKRSSSLSVSKS